MCVCLQVVGLVEVLVGLLHVGGRVGDLVGARLVVVAAGADGGRRRRALGRRRRRRLVLDLDRVGLGANHNLAGHCWWRHVLLGHFVGHVCRQKAVVVVGGGGDGGRSDRRGRRIHTRLVEAAVAATLLRVETLIS